VLLVFVGAISLLDLFQQQRSGRALRELARLSAPRARVRRGGVDLDLPADQVRNGDLQRLEEGDRIAADASLQEGVGLWLDESLISGQSLPVRRERPGERVLAGSLVTSGRGLALVQAVGEASELGRLGRDLRELRAPATPLQRRARRLTAQVTAVALGLCALLTLLQASVGGEGPRAVLAGLALALALLPNEIPVVVSLFLALGALRLSRIGVLAR
ncbi:MAG: ATPase, partial [Cyanobium sp.]